MKILDLSGCPMHPGSQVFAFHLVPNLRTLCFGNVPRCNFNSMALLEQWLMSFAPNIIHAQSSRAIIQQL